MAEPHPLLLLILLLLHLLLLAESLDELHCTLTTCDADERRD